MADKRYGIIYEDGWLIIVDKPSGMLVIPTPKKEMSTLTDLLNRELDSRGIEALNHSLRSGSGQANAHPCHRLDRETSGLIIYSKGKSAQRLMMDQFKKRAVKKAYIAFVQGLVKKEFDIISGSIYNINKKRPEEAVTKYKVLERKRDFTVLEVEPVTGRTNQIRIHLKSIGHPLVGESVFAFRKDYELRFKRAALHAAYLRFTHPVTRRELEFSAPLPSDMERPERRGRQGHRRRLVGHLARREGQGGHGLTLRMAIRWHRDAPGKSAPCASAGKHIPRISHGAPETSCHHHSRPQGQGLHGTLP